MRVATCVWPCQFGNDYFMKTLSHRHVAILKFTDAHADIILLQNLISHKHTKANIDHKSLTFSYYYC